MNTATVYQCNSTSALRLGPETVLEEINGDLPEADFGTTSWETALRLNFRLARQPEVTKALIPTSGLPVIGGQSTKRHHSRLA
jgi:hypothetical protein